MKTLPQIRQSFARATMRKRYRRSTLSARERCMRRSMRSPQPVRPLFVVRDTMMVRQILTEHGGF